jgi:carbamate kinase
MERKPTLVVALGGNALLKRGEPLEAEIQRQNIEQAARTIAGLTEQWRVVLVHGNGPQVGLLALQNSAYDKVTPYPLDVLGAESQGMIGYMLQQALKNNAAARGERPAHAGGSGRRRPGLQQPDQIHRPGVQRSPGKNAGRGKRLGV